MSPCEDHSVETLQSSAKPVPARASKAVISAYAEDIARQLGFQIGNTLEPIVATLGGIIAYRNPIYVNSNASESIVVRGGNDFTIYLGTMTSPERDRFTIAHELGHLFIHYPLTSIDGAPTPMIATTWVDDDDEDQRRAEWEANWFAAAFLMPAEDFASYAKQMDLNELAMTFSVSYSAAEMRKTSLGIT